MLGDGNCIYYCMLHFLYKMGNCLVHGTGKNYPLIWLRKLIRDFGLKMNHNYWIFPCPDVQAEKLRSIFDPNINYMDEVVTRDMENAHLIGGQFDLCIFAAAF